jgi:hypothetical protein
MNPGSPRRRPRCSRRTTTSRSTTRTSRATRSRSAFHWLQAISVAALSDASDRDIWPYRIPSLLGAMLAAAACAWGGAALFGARAGLLAGAMMGASFLLSTEAGIAKTDAVQAGATTLALAAMARIYLSHRGGPPVGWKTRLLFWLGIGVAALVKGPVGPLVALLAGLALWASERRIDWAKSLGWSWGPLLVLAIVGPWAWAITVASDGAFWGAAIGGDLAPKLVGGHERHGGLFGYHAFLAPMLTFPGSLLLPAGAGAGLAGPQGAVRPVRSLLADPDLADVRTAADQAGPLQPAGARGAVHADGRRPARAAGPDQPDRRRGHAGLRQSGLRGRLRRGHGRVRRRQRPDLGCDHHRSVRRHGDHRRGAGLPPGRRDGAGRGRRARRPGPRGLLRSAGPAPGAPVAVTAAGDGDGQYGPGAPRRRRAGAGGSGRLCRTQPGLRAGHGHRAGWTGRGGEGHRRGPAGRRGEAGAGRLPRRPEGRRLVAATRRGHLRYRLFQRATT